MRPLAAVAVVIVTAASLTALAPAAQADHTDPRQPLAPTYGAPVEGIARGEGVWEHVANFPGLAGPGW